MNSTIPVIMCIDVEPDDRSPHPDRPCPWRGYVTTHDCFGQLRKKISGATGSPARFSWFFRLDPQVARVYGSPDWALRQYPELVAESQGHGDEIGLHAHPARWDEDGRFWVAEFGAQSWIEHCVKLSLETFHGALGRRCDSFRFGDRWMNNQTLKLLEQQGVRFDLTLEPGHPGVPSLTRKERSTGSISHSHGAPRHPYRPLHSNFLAPDPQRKEGIWMIPLSSGPVKGTLDGLSLFALNAWLCTARRRSFWRDSITLDLAQIPRLFRSTVNWLLSHVERPYLALIIRSDISLQPLSFRNLRKNFEFMLRHPLSKRFAFSTPREAMQRLGYI
jgi:hypothetical protein